MILIIIVVMLFVIMVKVSGTAKTSKMIKRDYKAKKRQETREAALAYLQELADKKKGNK